MRVLLFLLPFCAVSARAQLPAADTLGEVAVRRARAVRGEGAPTLAPGLKTSVLDSTLLVRRAAQSLATLLAEHSSVFVKSYGINGLATLGFRGASAAQSVVVWNGVPLQNAALGVADVSIISAQTTDRATVVYGAAPALWGSGSVGGGLLLENPAPSLSDSALRWSGGVNLSAGSFGQRGAGGRAGIAGGKAWISARGFYQSADNDFLISTATGRDRQLNARLQGWGILLDAGYQITPRSALAVHAWAQRYARQIPRALFEGASLRAQADASARAVLHYSRQGRLTQDVRVAFLEDSLRYDDPLAGNTSRSRVQTIFAEWQGRRTLGGRWDATVILPVQYAWMTSTATAGVPDQRRLALVAALRKTGRRAEFAGTIRTEQIDQQTIILPGISAAWVPTKAWQLRGSVQRAYRTPTLLERYIFPGGNPLLRPEVGWSGDAGATWTRRVGSVALRQDGAVYYRAMQDWIVWYGGAVWTPHNIAAVRSRGAEWDGRADWTLGKGLTLAVYASAAHNRATTTRSEVAGDGSIGRQIPYVPLWQGRVAVQGAWRGVWLSVAHHRAGLRYVTTDETDGLPAYAYTTAEGGWEGRLAGQNFSAGLRLSNIENRPYAVVAGRPLPGFWALLQLGWVWNSVR